MQKRTIAALALLIATGVAQAQVHTLASSTLTQPMDAVQPYMVVASAAGITRTGATYIDNELVRVDPSYNGTALTVPLIRLGSNTPHASGAATLSGDPSWFHTSNAYGGCTLALVFASPWVNTTNTNQYLCTGGTWVLQGGGGGGGGGGGPNLITLSISGSSLTIGGVVTACASLTPCFASVGNGNPITYTNQATAAPAAGSDTWYVWIDKNGTRNVGYSAVVPTCTNCTAVAAITSAQTGSGGISLGSVTVVSGMVTAVSPTIPVQSAPLNVICGTSINCTPTATGITLDVDLSIPQVSHSANYTTILSDAGKEQLHPTADNNARTYTIDSNANVPYPVGTILIFTNQINTLTIAITSDTLQLAGSATTGSRTLAAGGMATAKKITATLWYITGPGLT